MDSLQFATIFALSLFTHIFMCNEGMLHKNYQVCYSSNCHDHVNNTHIIFFDNKLDMSWVMFLMLISFVGNSTLMCASSAMFFGITYFKYMKNRKQCMYFCDSVASLLYVATCVSVYYTFCEEHKMISFLLLMLSSSVIPKIFTNQLF